jgi:GNAT superfamily N-acetyltransferase
LHCVVELGDLPMLNSDPSTERRSIEGATIKIRPAQPSDHEDIKRVWQDAFGRSIFGGERTYDDFLIWAYEKNPDRHSDSVTQWVAESDKDIVAAWSAMPVRLLVQGKSIEACWLQNTAVASRAQRKGIGRRMFREIIPKYPLTMGVGLTQASKALYQSERAHFVPADQLIVLHVSTRMMARDLLAAIYHLRFYQAWSIIYALASRRFSNNFKTDFDVRVVPTKHFGEEFDDFISRISSIVPIMVHRNSAKLNWIMENPRLQTMAFSAFRGTEPCGYAIVRRDGMLLDLLVHPEDMAAFTAILARVWEWAKEIALPQLNCMIPGFTPFSAMYVKCGFLPTSVAGFGLFYTFPLPQQESSILADPRNWYLSMADSDLWSFALEE